MTISKILNRFAVFSSLALLPALALSQSASDFPSRPITLVVNSEAGGATDVVARAIQEAFRVALGGQQSVVIENQSAAGGIVGADKVGRAKPDGYTLLVTGAGPMVFAPLLSKSVSYNPERDFQHIALMAVGPSLLVSNPKLEAHSLKELIALAKKKPGSITFASSGLGTPSHLAGELFKQLSGTDLLHVPYRGSRQASTALLAGEVDVMFSPPSATVGFIEDGRLRALAVTSTSRLELAPKVPTSAEAGLPELQVLGWFGLLAPAGTPASVVAKLSIAMNTALNESKAHEMVARSGFEPVAKSDPTSFSRFTHDERIRWKKVIDTAGLKLD